MFRRSPKRAMLTGLMLLAVPLCVWGIVRADDAAEFNRLDKEAQEQRTKGKYAEMERTAQKMKELAEGGLKEQPLRLAVAPRYLRFGHRKPSALRGSRATLQAGPGDPGKGPWAGSS